MGGPPPQQAPNLLVQPNPRPAPHDPELAWMVGIPLFKGGIFGGNANPTASPGAPAMPNFAPTQAGAMR
jgi:hypothetical protein